MHTFLQKQRLRTCITKRSKMLEQGLEKFDAVETLTDLQRKKLVFFSDKSLHSYDILMISDSSLRLRGGLSLG